MNRLQAARAALVALSAIGMIWANPALAANYDASATSGYAKPKEGTSPHPTVPHDSGTILQAGPSDLDVDYIGVTGSNGSYQWTYHVKNIGTGSAYNSKVMNNALRNNYMGDIESDIEYVTLGTIAPGVTKTVIISCVPKWQQPACATSSTKASTTSVDSNPGNDWDVAPNILP